MKIPNSSYRIQFNKEFNFSHFEQIIDYLEKLGIDTIYASPILGAVKGSTHGYDSTDLHQINPEIGTIAQFRKIGKRLRKKRINWLQDIVPNHMAFHPENAWLMDVLQYGKASPYAAYFDTVLSAEHSADQKLMVPVLGSTLAEALRSGDIAVVRNENELFLQYYEQQLPLSPASYLPQLLDLLHDAGNDRNKLDKRIAALKSSTDTAPWKALCQTTMSRLKDADLVKDLDELVAAWNHNPDKLGKILNQQHYQLCHWQDTDQRINYRRFFTVNGLICLNVQNPVVFDDVHHFIHKLIQEGLIDGLRVDHIDGLYQPSQYLSQLRELCGSDTYIVAEKILEQHESLPTYWPIQGTTGYDFLAHSHNVATHTKGFQKLHYYYETYINTTSGIPQEQLSKKRDILMQHMHGELDNLVSLFRDLHMEDTGISTAQIKNVLPLFLCHFPIYRLYDSVFPLPNDSFQTLLSVFDAMAQDTTAPTSAIRDFRNLFYRAQQQDGKMFRKKVSTFLSRCMQFTGPLMAKGVEDTLMYTYNAFLGQNEVGNHPENNGLSIKKFHQSMKERQLQWPLAMNSSGTHDTKRGEDSRSRLLVLTAKADAWIKHVKQWEKFVQKSYDGVLPHINDRYTLYQALYGAHPMPGSPTIDFEERLQTYLVKYLREGKIHSNWAKPREDYEKEVQHFAHFLLDKENGFLSLFHPFLEDTVDFGIVNSLVQLVLKFTCPGVPDIYQGTELWDLSFVDPDNRRAVDYDLRKQYLQQISSCPKEDLLTTLWEERYDGKIKLWLMQQLIGIRKHNKALSQNGNCLALKVKGKYRRNILAFAREKENECIITIVPLHIAGIKYLKNNDIKNIDWEDTRVILPDHKMYTWNNLLTGQEGTGAELHLTEIFEQFPVAIISCSAYSSERKAGILLSITSLPSAYGIGDLGKPSFRFAQQLSKAQQRCWQILPWNPTSAEQYYSPYSTLSAMAGNPLLISLDSLQQAGLLRKKECQHAHIPSLDRVNYMQVEAMKMPLLDIAFQRICLDNDKNFKHFCQREAYWLNDYALFMTIRQQQDGRPWYTWPIPLRSRHKKALTDFSIQYATDIQKEKWIQYIFFQQWQDLQRYTQSLGIRLLGDVPFYISLDSADVWAHPSFFLLQTDGKPRSIAGVPPDYFNADGQLWGMPIFDWQALKRKNYSWWIERLKHLGRLFDLVRLDHFRAFSAYWEIPADAESARYGKWQTGPGNEFFEELQNALPEMPFIAEDLGDIDDAVYQLRDRYRLPGMKVLQFAFGDDMPQSPHIPHQFSPAHIVYTGTHDNNTLLGWYETELDEVAKKRVATYLGTKTNAKNVNKNLIKIAYSSVAKLVIIPIQDVIGLNADHRMNSPASTTNNWVWRMHPDAFTKRHQKNLKKLTQLYNR